ncbi:MAG: eL32 family ribosomal protein [Candidatus Woesearchaeota archaeon]
MEEIKTKKRKKPNFDRPCSNKQKRISRSSWRKPDGLHSKMRLCHRGHRKKVKIGYKNSESLRGLEKEGFKKVIVKNLEDIKKIDPKKEIAVIGNVGLKKKIEIVKEAEKMKIKLQNIRDIKQFLSSVEERIINRKRRREKIVEKRSQAKKEKPKEKEKEEKEISQEEREKQERLEKEKIIIKKS